MSVETDQRPTPTKVVSRSYLLEAALLLAGTGCLAFAIVSYSRYNDFQQQSLPIVRSTSSKPANIFEHAHAVIGRITIKRIGLSVLMVEGDDEESLALAAGHMPGTAAVGRKGNVIISGHRDSAFWPLRNVKVGDRIEIKADTVASYRVDRIGVIEPENVAILADSDKAILTLVTCYPFRHIGPAPQRFIVRASLLHPTDKPR